MKRLAMTGDRGEPMGACTINLFKEVVLKLEVRRS